MTSAHQEIERLIHDFRQRKDVSFLKQAWEVVFYMDPEAGKNARQKEGLRRAKLHDLLKLLAEVDAEFKRCIGPMYDGPVYMNVPVPGNCCSPGIAPESIEDPVARKAYEDALALNAEKATYRAYRAELWHLENKLISALEFSLGESASVRRETGDAVDRIIENPSLRARIHERLRPKP